MSGTKRMIEDEDNRRNIALQIAIEAGVLKPCEYHNDIVISGNENIQSAYKLGNHKFSLGAIESAFETRREMTDTIQSVIDEYSAEECGACAKHREE